jgi:hypothetical protein
MFDPRKRGENMKEQQFSKVSDFLNLDDETFQRMLLDLIEWHRYMRKHFSTLKGLGYVSRNAKLRAGDFIWVDDGVPGCSGTALVIENDVEALEAKNEQLRAEIERLKQPQKILSAGEVTEPGWYWWTPVDAGTIEIVEVDYEYTSGQQKRLVFIEIGKAILFPLSGQFIGPLKAPEV